MMTEEKYSDAFLIEFMAEENALPGIFEQPSYEGWKPPYRPDPLIRRGRVEEAPHGHILSLVKRQP